MALEQAGLLWVNENFAVFIREVDRSNEAMASVGTSAESSTGGINILGSAITGFTTAIATKAIDAVVGLGSAMIDLGRNSIDVATEFQSSMADLTISAKSTGLEFDELQELALAVGGDTRLLGVSASGAAEAMTGLFKAGLDVNQVMGDTNAYMEEGGELGGALRASIDLAAATTLDMVEASDLAAITLATFGAQAEESGQSVDQWILTAMDNIVKTADASVAEVDGLGEALKYASPTAASLGISLEDLNVALGVMSTAGKQGSSAGTDVNRMLLDLTKTTPKAVAMMEHLGITAFDQVTGEFLPLVDIIGQFELALEGATDAEEQEALQAIFTSQGQSAMTTLLEKGVQGWVDMKQAVADATGTQAQAEEKSKTYAAQAEALEGVIETLQIRIGTALLPVLTELAKTFSGFVEQHGPLLEQIFQVIGDAAMNFVSSLQGEGGLISTFSTIITWIQSNWPAIQETVVTVFGKVQEVFQTIFTWVQTNWPMIQAVIQTAWTVIEAIISSVVTTIVDTVWPQLQEAFNALKELDWETIGKLVKNIAIIIGGVFTTLVGIITGIVSAIASVIKEIVSIVDGFMDTWKEVFEGFAEKDIKKILKGFGKLLVQGFTVPFKLVYKAIKGFIDGIIGFFKNLADKLVGHSIITDMMDKMQKIIEDVLNAIERFIERILDSIIRFVEDFARLLIQIWERMSKALEDAWEATWEFIEKVLDIAISTLKAVMETLSEALKKIWNSLASAIEKAWETLWTNVQNILNTVKTALSTAFETFTSAIKTIWETFTGALKTAWETLWTGIRTALDTAIGAITTAIQTFRDTIQGVWTGLVDTLRTAWETFWNSLSGFVTEAWDSVNQAVRDGIDSIVQTISDKISALKQAGQDIVNGIRDGLVETWSNIVTAIGERLSALRDAFAERGSFWGRILEMGKNLLEGIKEGVRNVWDTLVTAIGSLVTTLSENVSEVWGKIKAAGGKIVDGIIDSVKSNWQRFIDWLKDAIIGWAEDLNPFSRITTGIDNYQTTAQPTTTTGAIDNSRTINIYMDQTFEGASNQDVFLLDVMAALSAARV